MWKHTGMTRFQQFHIDTKVWDHMIFHHEILFWIFPQHLETEAILQTVHSTGLGFAVDSDCLASALGWGPFVLGAMNIMKESDLALNLQHTHTSMLNWGSTVYPYYGTYTLISSILSPLTLFVNATETDWVVFPVFRYHIISGLKTCSRSIR